jgi:hypothetical protein
VGVDVKQVRFDGAVHGFGQTTTISVLARKATDDCVELLRGSFAGKEE